MFSFEANPSGTPSNNFSNILNMPYLNYHNMFLPNMESLMFLTSQNNCHFGISEGVKQEVKIEFEDNPAKK